MKVQDRATGLIVEFPDGTDPAVIAQAMRNVGQFAPAGGFNERFGAYEENYSPWNFLFPNFASCDPGIAVEYYRFSFKCFQDDELFYNPSGEDCEYFLNHAGLAGIKNNTLSIAPNPVSSNENITINAQGNYTIVDIQGKAIQKGTIENNSVQLINVESGIYFFILDNENVVYKNKFVVR